MTETLAEKKCTPCRGGIAPLTHEEAAIPRFSTILTLVVIPVIYNVVKGWRVPVMPLQQAQGRCVEEPGSVHEQVG